MKNKTKEVFMTWDGWCLLKLKELGKSTIKEWAEAMGYKHSICMDKTIKNNLHKLNITRNHSKRINYYEIKSEA